MEPADAMSYLNWRRYISAATILGGNLEKVVSEMTIKHLSSGGYFINGGCSSLSFFMLLKGAAAMWLLEVLCAAARLFIIFLFSRQPEKTKSQVRYLVHSSSSSQREKS